MKRKKFISIRYKFTIFFIFTLFIPIFLISIISYYKFFHIIQNKISESNLISIKQTGSNIEFVLDDIHQLSLDLYQDSNIRNLLSKDYAMPNNNQHISKTEQWLKYIISSNTYIHSIYIKGFNGIILNPKSTNDEITKNTEKEIVKLKGMYLWQANRINSYDSFNTPVLSISRTLKNIDDITADLGILKINISEQEIANIYKNNLIDPEGKFLMINHNNQIISTLEKIELYQSFDPDVFNTIIHNPKKYDYYVASIDSRKTLVTYYKFDNLEWFLVNLVPLDNLLKSSKDVYEDILLAIIISFILFSILTLTFFHKLLKPLKEVRRVMTELPNDSDFKARINIKGNDEIALLGKSFNHMSKRLNELMNQVYLVKIKQKEAELKALQAQINPHFLYNTLDTIYWMSCMENAKETSSLVQALGKLFRLSLNHGHQFTTVEKEIEHLKNYILIQKKRYDGDIDFNIDADPDTLNNEVIKLILQPLIENAVYHGIEPKGEPGKIDVLIYHQDDCLYYEVRDNGIGVDDKEIRQLLSTTQNIEKNHGFALHNVNARIKLYYGDKYGIDFHSLLGSGTTVIVRQPYKKGEYDHAKHADCG